METLIKNNWIKALLINLIIAAAILSCAHMVYETNDDYVISSRIAVGYAAVYFVNYYLCALLTKIQGVTTEINVFVIAQILTSFASWVCITKLLLDKSRKKSSLLACIAVIAVLSFDSYCRIQFSKTAALACFTGMLVTLDAFAGKRSPGYYIAGILLTYIGVAFRSDALIVAVAFAGLLAIKTLTDNTTTLKELKPARIIAGITLAFIVVAGGYALKNASTQVFESDEDLRQYREYNALRSEVVDTPLLDGYENRLDEYTKIGLSKNDIELIRGWMFDYEGAASKENLESIVKIGDGRTKKQEAISAVRDFVKETRSGLKNVTTSGIRIMLMVALALWLLALSKGKTRFYILAVGLGTIVLHIYLCYTGRPANRTMYIPDICAMISMLYVATEIKEKEKLNTIMAAAILIIAVALLVPTRKNAVQMYEKAERGIMTEEFADYIQEHQDAFFVASTGEKGSSSRTLTPWKAPDITGERNIMGAGSWGTMSPYLFDKMGKYGLYNPIKDIIDNDKAYFVSNKNIDKMTEYYNKWHADNGSQIYLEEIDSVGGKTIWKVKTRNL